MGRDVGGAASAAWGVAGPGAGAGAGLGTKAVAPDVATVLSSSIDHRKFCIGLPEFIINISPRGGLR